MKTAYAVFLPYFCAIFGSWGVSMKIGYPTFIVLSLNHYGSGRFFPSYCSVILKPS